MEKNNDIDLLLTRLSEGSITPEEEQRLGQWLEADEEHRRALRDSQMLGLADDTERLTAQLDADEALLQLRRRTRRTSATLLTWFQRAAAVLLLPLLGIVAYMALQQSPREVAQMMEVRTNAGMTTTVVLPDSTVVCLNSESVLRYPSAFTGDSRTVSLTGEAYFDVTHDPTRRFVVATPGQGQVEVYGTSFNVEAYAREGTVSTTLVEGSVGFRFIDRSGHEQLQRLTPRHKLVYSTETHRVALTETTCERETAWKDGKVIFDNTPMRDILRTLGRRYNVDFIVSDRRIEGYSFTGTISSQRLERIMQYFKLSSGIRWRYADDGDLSQERQKIEIY